MDEKRWTVREIYEPQEQPDDKATRRREPNPDRIELMSDDDKPREKLLAKGAEALTKAELLAILIGSGNRKESAVQLMNRMLKDCQDSLRVLTRMSAAQMMLYNGIGEAKALSIVAACELGRRRELERQDDKPLVLNTPELIYKHICPYIVNADVEEAYAIYLNQACRHMKTVRLSHGGMTETAVDVRMLIKEALFCNATVVILVHNHPSGNVTPSRDDDNLTKKVKAACDTMRLQMLDHLVVSDTDYYSYRDQGKL